LLSPLVALVLVGFLSETTPLVEMVEDMTVNLRFKARAPFDPPADPRLVFVGIDEASLDHLGRWPLPRTVERDFLAAIANSGMQPRAIAFDLMFTEETNKLDPDAAKSATDADKMLGDATGLLPGVITGAFSVSEPKEDGIRIEEEKHTQDKLAEIGPTLPLPTIKGDINTLHGSNIADLPVEPVRTQSLFAFVNDDPSKVDAIRHTVPLVLRLRDKVYPSLALQTLCQLLSVDADKVEIDLPRKEIRLTNISGKKWTIPISERGEFAINYRRQDGFRNIGFYWLLRGLGQLAPGAPAPPQFDVKDKALLVGGSATAIGDTGPTPLDSIAPLPYVHLNMINNVLQNDYLTFVPWYWVVLGWSLVTWPTLLRLKDAFIGEAIFVPITIEVVYIVGAFVIFWLWSVQIALAWPVISYAALNFGGIVLRWREERKGRQQIKQIFSRMVSPEIMNHLLEHPENMQFGGSDRQATLLFSDIRGFTEFSEGLDSEEVMRQLNVYFERMVGCVNECKGTLHKFIGDAIMAAWGDIEAASLGTVEDAQNAVRSALLMRKRLRELNVERVAENLSPIRIGVGLNHGRVQAGMLGSTGRMEFTVIGDTVNTASRLEGLTKEFKTDLAVSESVKELIGETFIVRRLGLIVLKGKSEATAVYEVIAEKPDLGHAKMNEAGVARYEEAFTHFLARRFPQAEEAFQACEKDYPDDYCVKNYLEATREFLVTPPPPDWDGRIVMTTK
jgi:adenylate cyclase